GGSSPLAQLLGQPLGNGVDGVLLDDAPGNFVGGVMGLGNVISGNTGAGVGVTGARASGDLIAANLIGTDRSGSLALPNSVGVNLIDAGAAVVGGPTPLLRNVISGNHDAGVAIQGGGGNRVEGNFIGLNR